MNETSVTRAGEWVKKAIKRNGNPRPGEEGRYHIGTAN